MGATAVFMFVNTGSMALALGIGLDLLEKHSLIALLLCTKTEISILGLWTKVPSVT